MVDQKRVPPNIHDNWSEVEVTGSKEFNSSNT